MNKTITLTEVDPIEILGVNNKLFDQFRSYFPALKATSRGNEIFLMGADDQIALFEEKLAQLIQKKMTRMRLNSYDVESLFEDNGRLVRKFSFRGPVESAYMSGNDKVVITYTDVQNNLSPHPRYTELYETSGRLVRRTTC